MFTKKSKLEVKQSIDGKLNAMEKEKDPNSDWMGQAEREKKGVNCSFITRLTGYVKKENAFIEGKKRS